MLTLIALLASVQAASAPTSVDGPVLQEEVTVIGKKLRDWRGSLKTQGKATRCVTKRSTGDRDIDKIGCDAMVTCFPRFADEFNAVLSTAGDKVSRSRMNAEINQRLTECVEERHDKLVETLADQRAIGRF